MAKDRKTKEELTKLFLMYQSNMFPSLVRWLAEELEVTEASINRLGVGFDYLKQAWVFAERNERGQIIGLPLRFVAGGKGCIEGSQRGLTYECLAETKKRGGTCRRSGYIPCRIAGVDCPKCGAKGRQWCMVSSDNPNDPSSCICGRTSEGAIEHLEGSGYRHQLRDDPTETESILSPLPISDHPTLVVEGPSDVLAAMDTGLVGVGKPNDMGGAPFLARLLRGRDTVVMGEHDSGAGERGMHHSGRQLLTSTANVRLLMPPVGYKDFRAWAPDIETFKAECTSNAKDVTAETKEKRLFQDATWEDKAKILVAARYESPKRSNLIYYDNLWWVYNGHCYDPLADDDEVGSQIAPCFTDYVQEYYVQGESEFKRVDVDNRFVRETCGALRRWRRRQRKRGQSEPFYLEGDAAGMGFDNRETIIFKNGMLDVSTGKLLPLTRNIFFRSSVPYAYNKLARCDRWLSILDQIFAGDGDCIALLQEWFGYNLITTNYLHAMMFLYGVSGSGKSTIATMLRHMVGEERCASPQVETACAYTFGMEPLLGKYVIQMDEEQDLKPAMRAKYLAFIKKLTGLDAQDIQRKNAGAVHERLFGKITHVCNKLLSFLDESQSLRRRINILKFNVSFAEHPDLRLESDLLKELPGIASWAVVGLQRVLKTEAFTRPEESTRIINAVLAEASPIRGMLEDHCVISDDKNDFTSRKMMYGLYFALCEEEKVKNPCGARLFRRRLGEAWPEMADHEGQDREQGRGYRGIRIKQESILMYLSGD